MSDGDVKKTNTTNQTVETMFFFFFLLTQHFHFIPLQKRGISRAPVKAEQHPVSIIPATDWTVSQAKERKQESFESQRKMSNISTVHFSHALEMQLHFKASAESRRC